MMLITAKTVKSMFSSRLHHYALYRTWVLDLHFKLQNLNLNAHAE